MTNFIEVTLTDNTKALVNINNIIDIHKVTDTEQETISALQNNDAMEEYLEAYKEFGLEKLLTNAFDEVSKGNTVLTSIAPSKNGQYNIYVLEEYNEVKKLLKEALEK